MSTLGVVRRDDSKLRALTKQTCIQLSIYRFKERLKQKCEQYMTIYREVDEHHTSMACGNCGCNNRSLGGNKVFTCPVCSWTWDRDANGARNIALQYFDLFEPYEAIDHALYLN